MRIGFAYNHGLSSVLTKFFTGSACYHVYFTDGIHAWDMNLLMRRRKWPMYPAEKVIEVECPVEVTREDLEELLETMDDSYGWKDYVLFALRPLYHLVGKSTRNNGGVICSELIYQVLVGKGWNVVFNEVPSPADLEEVILGERDFLNKLAEAASCDLRGPHAAYA